MAEEGPKKPMTVNYGSNSNKQKTEKPKENLNERNVQKVTTGAVIERKKTVGSKFRETFVGDDAQSVGAYLLFDVVVPATKNLIFDMLSEGAKRLLFGSGPRPGTHTSAGQQRTNYQSVYRSNNSSPAPRELSSRSRTTHDFAEILLENRGEAEQVLDQLTVLIEEYGVATVSDLYASVGVTAVYTDTQFGWKSLSSATVRHMREGYLLDLPPAKKLD